MKPLRISSSALVLAFAIGAAVVAPAAASASPAVESAGNDHAEVTVRMVPTCAPEFPDCDLGEARGAMNGTCGTSTIYVDKIGTHKGRVSWGMHVNTGYIVLREIRVAWGPAGGGSFPDVSAMYGSNYSNSRVVSGSGNLSATIGGAVQLVGNKYVHCTIPFHSTNTIRI